MSLGDRLSAARRAHFVGRKRERHRFSETLRSTEPEFDVLFIHGPGGIGKTSLLQAFGSIAEESKIPCDYVDLRDVEPVPEAFLETLARRSTFLGLPYPHGDGNSEHGPDRAVLLLDTWEEMDPIDTWFRDVYLPQLPSGLLVVLAGRSAPNVAWHSDPGWREVAEVWPLDELDERESRTLALRLGVPPNQEERVLALARGHPLALALAAEAVRIAPERPFELLEAPTVIEALLCRFVDDLPSRAHRTALEACMVLRSTTEPLLEGMLGDLHEEVDIRALFDWLGRLPFVEVTPSGLLLHDLARDVLEADLRWRSPDRIHDLHRRAGKLLAARLRRPASSSEQERTLMDFAFLYRKSGVAGPLLKELRVMWRNTPGIQRETARADNWEEIRQLISSQEGEDSAVVAEYWYRHSPEAFEVYRTEAGDFAGLLVVLRIENFEPSAANIDPGAAAALAAVSRHGELAADERALLFRFWMATESYQSVSPVQSLIFARTVWHYLTTPALAFSIIPCFNGDAWAMLFDFVGLTRCPEGDFTVDDRSYAAFSKDWRAVPPETWLATLGSLSTSTPRDRAADNFVEAGIFAEALKKALQRYTRPNRLRGNALLHTAIIAREVDAGALDAERGEALRTLLEAETAALEEDPRTATYGQALRLTYLKPAPTQALAAERMDMPFSTYRRHLANGLRELTEALWAKELAARGNAAKREAVTV
ncbi:ATP-binding protein [soil metagenome]